MTLQNNSTVPRKLVTIPKLFFYAILSKIVLLDAILHKYIFVLLFDVSCDLF